MFRSIIGFALTVVVARWIYAEIQLAAPFATPLIDALLEKVQIPTHDKWDKEKVAAWIKQAAKSLEDTEAASQFGDNGRLEGEISKTASVGLTVSQSGNPLIERRVR